MWGIEIPRNHQAALLQQKKFNATLEKLFINSIADFLFAREKKQGKKTLRSLKSEGGENEGKIVGEISITF